MNNLKVGPLDISSMGDDGIKVMAEISFGSILLTIDNNRVKIVGISKDGTDGSYGVPKGKENINEELFVESPEETLKREVSEEAGLILGENAKIILRLTPDNFKEEIIYKYKEKDFENGDIPNGKIIGDTKEKVNKTTELTPLFVAFQLDLLNKLKKGEFKHLDGEEKGGYSEGKERKVELIDSKDVERKFKKEQVESIKKAITELNITTTNKNLNLYMLDEVNRIVNS